MAINGPLTNRGLVTFSLVKRMTELREEKSGAVFIRPQISSKVQADFVMELNHFPKFH